MERTIRHIYTPRPFTQRVNSANRFLIEPGHWDGFDPFLVLMEDRFHAPDGFPDHPHRGIETVTLVLDGELRHADNRGNSGVLESGDLQWMTAGGGIIHAELPWQQSTVHSLQLWVNLPSVHKMVDSNYQDLRGVESILADDDGLDIRVVSGNIEGIEAPTRNLVPIMYLDVRARAGKRATLPIPAGHNGFIHILDGSVLFGPERTPGQAGQVLWLDFPELGSGDSSLSIDAETAARFLLVTGLPVRERVVARGPFVMNSSDEIAQAYADYHAGRFGGPTPAAMDVWGELWDEAESARSR